MRCVYKLVPSSDLARPAEQDHMQASECTARGLVHHMLTHGGLEDINRFCEDMNAGKLAGRAVIKGIT